MLEPKTTTFEMWVPVNIPALKHFTSEAHNECGTDDGSRLEITVISCKAEEQVCSNQDDYLGYYVKFCVRRFRHHTEAYLGQNLKVTKKQLEKIRVFTRGYCAGRKSPV